ncbi:MAG: hypothetical protein QM689_11285 [Oscillospiraceae bacterium]
MKFRHQDTMLLRMAVLSEFLSAAVIFFLPAADAGRKLLVVAGILLWFFMLNGYLMLFLLNKRRIRYMRKRRIVIKKSSWGIFMFCSTKPGTLFDVLLAAGLIAFFLPSFFGRDLGEIMKLPLFLFVFSFQMHCIFNGENYKYIALINERGNRNG